jgi:hypothetical protein
VSDKFNDIEEGFSVYSVRGNATFNFYKVVKQSADDGTRRYCVMDSSLTEIKQFKQPNEAKNFARYCAAAICEYMNGQSKLSDDFTDEDLKERLNSVAANFGIFEEDTRSLFVKEHGAGPTVSYKAMAGNISASSMYLIRWENINTNVIFENKELALKSLNNYLSISDWEVHDYKFNAKA